MARDTGTCSRARIEAHNCSTRTLPLAPPALSTPAGVTRRPSAPTGTLLRNATHLNSRSCFVLTKIGTRVKVGLPDRPPVGSCLTQPPAPNRPYSPLTKACFRRSQALLLRGTQRHRSRLMLALAVAGSIALAPAALAHPHVWAT